MSQALALAGQAVELRRELVDPARPVTLWELANSLQLRGSMLCSATIGEQGAADLLAAWHIASGLQGASAEHLRGELSQEMRVAEATYPDVVAALDWPVLPRSGAQPTSSDRAALAEAVVLMQRGRQREAATVLTRLAESGSREAMHALALLRDQMGDSRQAGEWFLRAAEAGNVDSMVIMGTRAARGGRLPEAERWLNAAAGSGDPDALFNYGVLLAQHLGRVGEALPLWERASEQGYALAALTLGKYSYQGGRRVDAERWFRRAAELGDAQAMFNLAVVLEERGAKAESNRWYRRGLAAEKR